MPKVQRSPTSSAPLTPSQVPPIAPLMDAAMNITLRDNKRRAQSNTSIGVASVEVRKEHELEYQLEKFREEIKSMISDLMSTQSMELKRITPTLMDIQQSNRHIEESMNFLTAQNEELKRKIEQMEGQARKDGEYILLLEDRLEDSLRSYRKTSLEIKNVPKSNNETGDHLVNMVLNLAKITECKFSVTDIKDIYRIKTKKDQSYAPIIVETVSTLKKNDLLQKCKLLNSKRKEKLCAKHLGITHKPDSPVYISEHLTPKGSRLFFLARDLAKSRGYKFCWTRYGLVYVRKDENSAIILIRNEGQVHTLLSGK